MKDEFGGSLDEDFGSRKKKHRAYGRDIIVLRGVIIKVVKAVTVPGNVGGI